MFTGIVEEIGLIRAVVRGGRSVRLEVSCTKVLEDAKMGDSIAVNGICLTVTGMGDNWFSADVMPETMRRTGLDKLGISGRVNLERALRLADRLGGHMVSGHIDGMGTVSGRLEEDNAIWLTIAAGGEILKYVVEKGSVALDGTSLTVAAVDDKSFKVSLIPLTRGITTLGLKKPGDMVNIECDVIGKYIEKLLTGNRASAQEKEGLSLDFLKDNGFV